MMLNMPPFIFEDMFDNLFEDSDHGPARCGASARGGCRGGRGRHQGRGHGPPGFGPGLFAGLRFGNHPMGPHHGWPRHGPPPHDGPRHGSPGQHHSPGPQSGPGRDRSPGPHSGLGHHHRRPHHSPGPHSGPEHHHEKRHCSPGSHSGSDHQGGRHRHSHSPGRHRGPGGHHHGRHGGGPWGHHGRHSSVSPSGLHLLRQHQGEGSIRIEVAEAQESYLIFAEVPGLPRKHLAAQLDNESGVLIISGSYPADPAASTTETILQERRHEEFRREFRLPEDVAIEGISAKLDNGELTVSLPKIAKPELTTIPILGDDNIPAPVVEASAPTKPDAAAPRSLTDKEAAPMEEDHEEDAWVDVTPKDDKGKAPMDDATARAIAASLQEFDAEGHVSDAEC